MLAHDASAAHLERIGGSLAGRASAAL